MAPPGPLLNAKILASFLSLPLNDEQQVCVCQLCGFFSDSSVSQSVLSGRIQVVLVRLSVPPPARLLDVSSRKCCVTSQLARSDTFHRRRNRRSRLPCCWLPRRCVPCADSAHPNYRYLDYLTSPKNRDVMGFSDSARFKARTRIGDLEDKRYPSNYA